MVSEQCSQEGEGGDIYPPDSGSGSVRVWEGVNSTQQVESPMEAPQPSFLGIWGKGGGRYWQPGAGLGLDFTR